MHFAQRTHRPNTRGIFVTERRSGSSFSEGRKPELRFGTFFRWHWYN